MEPWRLFCLFSSCNTETDFFQSIRSVSRIRWNFWDSKVNLRHHCFCIGGLFAWRYLGRLYIHRKPYPAAGHLSGIAVWYIRSCIVVNDGICYKLPVWYVSRPPVAVYRSISKTRRGTFLNRMHCSVVVWWKSSPEFYSLWEAGRRPQGYSPDNWRRCC